MRLHRGALAAPGEGSGGLRRGPLSPIGKMADKVGGKVGVGGGEVADETAGLLLDALNPATAAVLRAMDTTGDGVVSVSEISAALGAYERDKRRGRQVRSAARGAALSARRGAARRARAEKPTRRRATATPWLAPAAAAAARSGTAAPRWQRRLGTAPHRRGRRRGAPALRRAPRAARPAAAPNAKKGGRRGALRWSVPCACTGSDAARLPPPLPACLRWRCSCGATGSPSARC